MTDSVTIETVELTPMEVVLYNLEAVTKAITMRYGLHPEADATEAAAVVIRELIADEQAVVTPPAAKAAPTTKAKVA